MIERQIEIKMTDGSRKAAVGYAPSEQHELVCVSHAFHGYWTITHAATGNHVPPSRVPDRDTALKLIEILEPLAPWADLRPTTHFREIVNNGDRWKRVQKVIKTAYQKFMAERAPKEPFSPMPNPNQEARQ